MLRTMLSIKGKPTAYFSDPSIEDACDRIRKLAHGLVEESREDMIGRQVTLYLGPVPGHAHESLPRKANQNTLRLGLDPLAMLAVVDRALRLHHHPAVKDTRLSAEHTQDVLTVTDCIGQVYEITITKK